MGPGSQVDSFRELSRRVQRLECERRFATVVAGFAVVALLVGFDGRVVTKTVDERIPEADDVLTNVPTKRTADVWLKGRTVSVHDDDDRQRGTLHSWHGSSADGAATLTLFSEDGRGQVSLGEKWYDDGPTLGLGYQPRIRMWVPPKGAGPHLLFRGNNDGDRIWAKSTEHGSELSLHDASGTARLRFVAESKGSKIEFLDNKGTVIKTITAP